MHQNHRRCETRFANLVFSMFLDSGSGVVQIICIYNKLLGDADSDVTTLGNSEKWFRTWCRNKVGEAVADYRCPYKCLLTV